MNCVLLLLLLLLLVSAVMAGGHFGIKQGEPNAMLDVRDILTQELKGSLRKISAADKKHSQQIQDLTIQHQELRDKVEGIGESLKQMLSLVKTSLSAQSSEGGTYQKVDGLIGIADFTDVGNEIFYVGTEKERQRMKPEPKSWNLWSKENANRPKGQPQVHFFTQLDHDNLQFVAQTACRTAKLMGDYGGNFFVHGLNKSDFHHDGTKCDDCNWIPDLHKLDRGITPKKREEANPTGSSRIFGCAVFVTLSFSSMAQSEVLATYPELSCAHRSQCRRGLVCYDGRIGRVPSCQC
jgi:hypothetical protein